MNKQSRRQHLESLKNEMRTMLFYEAPHKLIPTLRDLCATFGADRKMALVRELTKIHEEVLHMTIGEAVDYYNGVQPKGEFVLIVEGKPESDAPSFSLEEAQNLAKAYLADGLSASAAAKQAAQETGFKKADLYKALLEE